MLDRAGPDRPGHPRRDPAHRRPLVLVERGCRAPPPQWPPNPELVSALDAYGRSPASSSAALRVGGRAIGVVTVLRDEDRAALDQDDLDLVIGLADRAAQAIHNGQRVARQLRRDAAFAGFAAEGH